MRRLARVACFFALVLGTAEASAAPEITYRLSLRVAEFVGSVDGAGIAIGDAATATITVDTNTPPDPTASDSTFARYLDSIVSGNVRIGTRVWTIQSTSPTVQNSTNIFNDLPDGWGFDMDQFFLGAPVIGPSINGLPAVAFASWLTALHPAPNMALEGIHFPESLDVADFNIHARASLGFDDNGDGLPPNGQVNLAITSVRVLVGSPIPEPSMLALLCVGLAGLVTSRRHG